MLTIIGGWNFQYKDKDMRKLITFVAIVLTIAACTSIIVIGGKDNTIDADQDSQLQNRTDSLIIGSANTFKIEGDTTR